MNNDAMRDLGTYIHDSVNTAFDLLDDASGLDRDEIAKELIRNLAAEQGIEIKVPGDTTCGRCGTRPCSTPTEVEVDPLCWTCIIEMHHLDD